MSAGNIATVIFAVAGVAVGVMFALVSLRRSSQIARHEDNAEIRRMIDAANQKFGGRHE